MTHQPKAFDFDEAKSQLDAKRAKATKFSELFSTAGLDAAKRRFATRQVRAFKPRLIPEQRKDIVSDFINGSTINNLADKYELTPAGVRYIVGRGLERDTWTL